MPDRPLSGVRVLDAAPLAAGPLVATLLGEQGVEVIKVEQPGTGDPMRQWGAQRDGIGLMFKSLGRNKKSVTLNMRHEAGRDLLRRLVATADVLVGSPTSPGARTARHAALVHARRPRRRTHRHLCGDDGAIPPRPTRGRGCRSSPSGTPGMTMR